MRTFNYSKIKEEKWDSEVLGLIAAIYRYAGKQELYLRQRPDELDKLVEIAKIQSTEASNAIEGIVTTNTRIKQLVEEKTTPKNSAEEEIAGYRDVLGVIHESFDAIPITQNYILQLHKMLYSHMNNPFAGRTKTVQNYISATYPDGHTEVLFTPMAPFETPEALDRICGEYNRVIGNFEMEPLIVIPVFIHDFLCIHPFIKYLLGTILAAYKDFEERFAIVEEKLPAIEMVRKAILLKIGKFTKQDIMELCPTLSISSVEGALRKLVKEGDIGRGGTGKSTYYVRMK